MRGGGYAPCKSPPHSPRPATTRGGFGSKREFLSTAILMLLQLDMSPARFYIFTPASASNFLHRYLQAPSSFICPQRASAFQPPPSPPAPAAVQVRAKHGLHEADMPEADALRANLQSFDFADFPTLTRSALRQLSDIVDVDIHKVCVVLLGVLQRASDSLEVGETRGCV